MNELRTVIPYFRPYRKGVVAGLAFVVIANLFTVAQPYLIKLAIDGLGDPDVTTGRISTYALLIVAAAVLGGAAKFGMRELLNGQPPHRVRSAERLLCAPPSAGRELLRPNADR